MVTYNHESIRTWIYNNFLMKTKEIPKNKYVKNRHSPSLLERLFKKCILKVQVEMVHVSALLKLNGNNSTIGFNLIKMLLEQFTETRSNFLNDIS